MAVAHRTETHWLNLDNNSREKKVVSADTMEVLMTPSMEGYKHIHARIQTQWCQENKGV